MEYPNIRVPAKVVGKTCDLCEEHNSLPSVLYLHGRCHMTAPCEVLIENGWLIVRCFIPGCRREIGRFQIVMDDAN